ncbi:MAG TPA: DUF3391 domain-containing protein, partial [Pseudothauera hydrothermalis]|nr:DUF3391 domain-containing protein [Pseudothauera hydrothermalis]
MLKRIPVKHLKPGMFIHELCGSWMEHPFWRSSFLLDDPADIRRIVECGIHEVWIDTARGADVLEHPEEAVAKAESDAAVERQLQRAAATAITPRVAMR